LTIAHAPPILGTAERQSAMASRTSKASKRPSSASAPQTVDAFLADLDHPRKPELLTLRRIILDAHPSISEGIKWNAPSFRTAEYFATFQLRAKDGVQVILHLGAKKRAPDAPAVVVADPASLLEWLGTDRASVKFRDASDIDSKHAPFRELLRDWIRYV
jgi:hypothetical protein